MTRILIVDDHPIFRQGLIMALAEAADLVICGEGASADEAIAGTAALDPDVLLLDLSMPGGGLAALRAIRATNTAVRIAVLTASEDHDDVMTALQAGAQGYILKGLDSRTLIDAVREVARGQGYVAPGLAARILADLSRETGPAPGEPGARTRLLAQLTPREEQVLRLVAAGCSNKEIAHRNAMQEKTVKHHMTRILQKLHVRNRTEAAMLLQGAASGLRTSD